MYRARSLPTGRLSSGQPEPEPLSDLWSQVMTCESCRPISLRPAILGPGSGRGPARTPPSVLTPIQSLHSTWPPLRWRDPAPPPALQSHPYTSTSRQVEGPRTWPPLRWRDPAPEFPRTSTYPPPPLPLRHGISIKIYTIWNVGQFFYTKIA
jgi:hypothetical protein